MSNYKTNLQSNNEALTANNLDLQSILNTINELPTISTPTISVNTSGLITATAGTKTSTHQLAFQPAKTITPSTTSQIAVSGGYYTGGNITVAGDSNLVAGNIKSGVSIFGVSGTLEEGGGSSGEAAEWSENEDAIVSGTISTYTNDRVTTVGSFAFYRNNLTTVSFPVATIIGSYAFYKCHSLASISFPAAIYIQNDAFGYCSGLTTVSFSEVTSISISAFAYCSGLTTASFPKATKIPQFAFYKCHSLASISFPAAIYIQNDAFAYCSGLTTVSFPNVTSIDNNAFAYCSGLTTVSFPKVTLISSYAFRNCTSLASLYLTGSSVCTLVNSNAFSSTPFAGYSSYVSGTPYIYVPSSLVSSYQSATNWTYFSSYFSAIEGGETGSGETGSGETISFMISGVEYQAENDMTWAEWCESDYNVDGYFISGEYIYDSNEIGCIAIGEFGETIESPNNVIIANTPYVLF